MYENQKFLVLFSFKRKSSSHPYIQIFFFRFTLIFRKMASSDGIIKWETQESDNNNNSAEQDQTNNENAKYCLPDNTKEK